MQLIHFLRKSMQDHLRRLGSESAKELVLLLQGLEAAVTVLRGGVDELDVEWLQVASLGSGDNALPESNRSLAGTANTSLDHNPVLIHLTVVGESSNRGNGLLGQINLSGTALLVSLLADAQHPLVDLSTVVVALLTGACNSGADTGRMPRPDTCDLTETTVSLTRKTGDTPTADHTLSTVSAGGGTDIENFTLAEDGIDCDLLLEEVLGKVNLLGDLPSVELNLKKVSDLLAELQLADLGVGKNAHDLAVLLDTLKLKFDILGLLSTLLSVLGESLSLGAIPVLVESALDLIRQVTSPHSGEGTKTIRGLNISDNTDNSHRRGLKDGNSLNSVLLVKLRARALDLTDNVSHTGLVSHEGSHVDRSLGVSVLGEGADATAMVLSSLLGKILQRTASRMFELTVRHFVSREQSSG